MSTVRWIFTDPVASETWTVPINPDSMSAPLSKRKAKFGNGFRKDTRVRTFLLPPDPMQFTFGGVIRTQAHYEALEEWSKKDNAITVTDHIGRVWRIVPIAFEPTDRRPTATVGWRLRYTFRATLLGGPT
jgi:hypothetical protein